ncbi:EIF3H isoform 7, partial [Pan troglodytes]
MALPSISFGVICQPLEKGTSTHRRRGTGLGGKGSRIWLDSKRLRFTRDSWVVMEASQERDPSWRVQYQMEMMRSLRHVNIDHLHVGWYQSTYYGSFVTRALLDSQFSYQHAIEESVVLIYDPIKTAQGSLSLKAYRLTPKLMEVCKEKDFSPEALKKANITFEYMFEEVPIVIKNSHLINVLMWELEKKSAVADKHELLSLASSNHLGKNLQLLMDRVDEMSQDIVKYNTYMRNTSKQQQQKHQ